ncbi:MAG: hypothetical protein R6V05_12685 [Candidatus Brocadiia bacterium]
MGGERGEQAGDGPRQGVCEDEDEHRHRQPQGKERLEGVCTGDQLGRWSV